MTKKKDDSKPQAQIIKADVIKQQPLQDTLQAYLQQIRKYPVLSKEKEYELSVLYQKSKDPKIAEILVTANLRFVVRVALEYSRFGIKLVDLIQEGNIGLIEAVQQFNPYKNTRLITYAVWWIRGYIQSYIMKQYSMVKIGTTKAQKKLFYKLKKETEKIKQVGQVPTTALLSERLDLPEKDIELMRKRLLQPDSTLDTGHIHSIEDEKASEFEDELSLNQDLQILRENIEKVKKQLNEKEIYILENRTLSEDPMTLNEIGEHFNVTREAIRQIENRLIEKIKSLYQKN